MFSFVKKMFGFVVFFGGFVAVSWRFPRFRGFALRWRVLWRGGTEETATGGPKGATEPNIFPGTMGDNVRMLHGASSAICGQPRAPKTMLICRPDRRKLRTVWSPKPTLFPKSAALGS